MLLVADYSQRCCQLVSEVRHLSMTKTYVVPLKPIMALEVLKT
jgi:hypothetical protein